MKDEIGSISDVRRSLARAQDGELDVLMAALQKDRRTGIRALLAATRARLDREMREVDRLDGFMQLQRELAECGASVVAGVDEVGRGALAGPVTAGAVVLRLDSRIAGLDDSKRLTPAARERVAGTVRTTALAWSVAHASALEIDSLGIVWATRLAWMRALDGLGLAFDHVLVDGNDATGIPDPSTAVIRGDSSQGCIAAASVIAKVERDSLMVAYAGDYPGYGLEINKGYGAADHMARLRLVGPCAIHRRSFAPCSEQDRLL